MKTLDFKTYEKLEIKQMTLSDLDAVQDKCLRQKDIVKLKNDDYYLVLLYDVFELYPEFHPFGADKAWISSNKFDGILLTPTDYRALNYYDSDLRCINERFWITDIFHMEEDWTPKFKDLYSKDLGEAAQKHSIEHIHIRHNAVQYTNEKLEIKPISISDLDGMGIKSDLKLFDIVEILNNLYAVFPEKTIFEYTDFFDDLEKAKNGVFYFNRGGHGFMYMSEYTEDLTFSKYGRKKDAMWNVKAVYKCDDNTRDKVLSLIDKLEQVNNKNLKHIISTYKYQKIIL